MSSSSQIRIRRVREATKGTLPAGAMDIVPFATWKMSGPIQREQPANVSADRLPRDNPATDITISGSATSDYIYGQYDGLMEEVSCAVFGAAVTVTATDITATVSGNKLVKGAGTWSTLAAGDVVKVTGFATNPAAFIALVTSVTSTDLALAWPTLVAEAAGPSVTVTYVGKLRQGTTFLTAHYEEFNLASTKGKQWPYVGVNSFGVTVPYPNRCQLDFGFTGGGRMTRLDAALANSSNAASTNPLRNSNIHFGGASVPTQGLGFRYAGVLMPDLRIQNLKLTFTNPLLAAGGAGALGPQDVSLDQLMSAQLEMTVYRNTADAEALIDDANDPDTVTAIGFGFRDGAGLRDYWHLPQAQPFNEETDGLKQAGREMVMLRWMLRYDATLASLFQYTKLG